MKTLEELRQDIDRVDEELVRLFSERMELSGEIALRKEEDGIPVTDRRREREKINAVTEMTPDEYKEYTPRLFELLMNLSKARQNRLIPRNTDLANEIKKAIETTPKLFPERAGVACQGIEGANSQLAAEKLFENPSILYFSTFDAVFSAIESGLCRYGLIPVENSTAGSVNSVYDLMMQHRFNIVRSIRVRIEHDLLAAPGATLDGIRTVYSHEQAIRQCSGFLDKMDNVEIIPCENTAVAARKAAESGDPSIAAIASPSCREQYGLSALARSIQNRDNNYTRFICISKELEIYPGANRTSIMLTLPHKAGSLYTFLSHLYALGINLNKLESRPLPDRDFEFMFYFDLDTPVYAPRFSELMDELPLLCDSFQYLGSYSEVI